VQFCPEATEFLKDVSFDITVLWDMRPCSFVDCYPYIGEYCWFEFLCIKVGGS